MLRNIKVNLFKILAITLFASNVYAEMGDMGKFAIGAKIGTQGVGAEGRFMINENVFARLGGNYFHYGYTGKEGSTDIKYNVKLTLLTLPVMVDFHPIDGSGFRLSAGIAYNGNKLEAKAKDVPTVVTLNKNKYTVKEIGNYKASLELGSKVGFIGSIGYDNSLISEGPVSFSAELGLMYSGKGKIKISSTASSNQQLIKDLEEDANKSLKKMKNYLGYFPVLSFGVKINL